MVAVNNRGAVKVFLCPSIDRPAGNGLDTSGLKELHSEVKHGGMVWTTLDPNPTQSVEEWTCGAFDCIAEASAMQSNAPQVHSSTLCVGLGSRVVHTIPPCFTSL